MPNTTGYYVNEAGETRDIWFREEDQVRKKFEKQATAQMKNRIAQSNR